MELQIGGWIVVLGGVAALAARHLPPNPRTWTGASAALILVGFFLPWLGDYSGFDIAQHTELVDPLRIFPGVVFWLVPALGALVGVIAGLDKREWRPLARLGGSVSLALVLYLGAHSLSSTVLVIALIVGFALGAPLFSVMLAATFLGGSMMRGDAEIKGALQTTFGNGTKDESIVFSTIPLFIYAGYIMAAGRTADRLVRFANAVLGWVPGGLAIVTIFACAVFTTFTGASGVTIIALGGVVMPALVKQRYPERFSLGLIAGTGSVGLLFPPALPLFIYGTVYGLNKVLKDKWDWDTTRFLGAGIVPGLVLLGCLSVVAVIAAIRWKVPRQKFDARELARSLPPALPELLMPALIIYLLFSGLASPPQVAGLTVLYMMILQIVVYRDIKPNALWRISQESLALIGTIFLVIYTSSAFTNVLVTAEVPQDLVKWTTSHVGSKVVFLLVLNVILLLVGTMMDIFSAVIVVLPLVAGIADYYGVNPYHLGVIFLLNLEIGYIHPPVGINLFIASFKFQRPLLEVTKAVLPFLGAMIVALIIVTYVPSLTVVPPPKRESPLKALAEQVKEPWARASAVPDVTLPGNKVKHKLDCDKEASEEDIGSCYGLFISVTECRHTKGADAEAIDKCEKDAIAGYLANNTDEDVSMSVGDVHSAKGTLITRAGCDKLNDVDKQSCIDLFVAIADCRAKTGEGAVLMKECEDGAIADYAEENLGEEPAEEPDDDTDDEGDDDTDDEGGDDDDE